MVPPGSEGRRLQGRRPEGRRREGRWLKRPPPRLGRPPRRPRLPRPTAPGPGGATPRGHDRGTGAGRPRTPGGAGQEPSGQDGTHPATDPSRRSGRAGRADRPGRACRDPEPPRRRQAEACRTEQHAGGRRTQRSDHGQQPGHGHPPGIREGSRRGAARHEAPCHVVRSGVTNPGPRVGRATETRPAAAGVPARRPQVPRRALPLAGPASWPVRGSSESRNGTAGKRCKTRQTGAAEAEEDSSAANPWPRMPPTASNPWMPPPPDSAGRAALRMLQLGVLAVGIVALIAGITLIVTGLAH